MITNLEEVPQILEEHVEFGHIHKEYIAHEANILELVVEVKLILRDFEFPLTPRLDFEFLAKCIRGKKYNPISAATAIKNYYFHISRYFRRLERMKPSNFTAAYESKTITVLRNKFLGTKVFYFNTNNWNTKKVKYRELQDSNLFVAEELCEVKEFQPYGQIWIINAAGFNFSHVLQANYSEMVYGLKMGMEGIPCRIEAIHLVNAPRIVWPLYQVAMKLIPEKVKKRIQVHRNIESLHKVIDVNILPRSLAGPLEEADAIDCDFINDILKYDRPYEVYWSSDIPRLPSRLGRKRSSCTMLWS